MSANSLNRFEESTIKNKHLPVEWQEQSSLDELAEFLQKFAITQRYFADGDGWAERSGIDAYEDSQWLFACGYYE